jgi:hypothetical protein
MLAPACIPSNVVAPQDRSVAVDPERVPWVPATPSAFDGLYASVSLTGDVAAGLWKVYYHFSPDGNFTGAALLQRMGAPTFEVLAGTWTLADGELRLGADAEPATAEMAPDLLRLRGAAGTVVLRREPTQ